MSFSERAFVIIWVFIISFWVGRLIHDHIIDPVNKEKMPVSLRKLRIEMEEDMNSLTKGLPKPAIDASYYYADNKKYPYDEQYLSTILENVPKDKDLKILPNEDDSIILSYCDFNVLTTIEKEYIEEKAYISIWLDFEERGICMEI